MPRDPKLKRPQKEQPPTVQNPKYICCRCGTAYSRAEGNFLASHSHMYRASGRIPWCNSCLEQMFNDYIIKYESKRRATKRMCEKLDLYWNDDVYTVVEKTAGDRSLIRAYISKINVYKYVDKSYDDTIDEEEKKAAEEAQNKSVVLAEAQQATDETTQEPVDSSEADDNSIEVPEEIKQAWGSGYSNSMYLELEKRLNYWKSQYPEGYKFDVGELALLRQICGLEIDSINDRMAGKAGDKNANTINTLVGSLNLKPTQKKDEADVEIEGTPLGVYVQMWEQRKPLPEIDDKYKDINGNVKNIYTWFYGATSKMAGIKNAYCRMFEDAMNKLRVKRPEFEGESDDELMDDVYSEESAGD